MAREGTRRRVRGVFDSRIRGAFGNRCALCALAHFFLLLADSQSLASFFPFSFFSITTVFSFLLPLPFAFFLLAFQGIARTRVNATREKLL